MSEQSNKCIICDSRNKCDKYLDIKNDIIHGLPCEDSSKSNKVTNVYEDGKVKWLMANMEFNHAQAKSIVEAKVFYKVKKAYEKLAKTE